MCVCVCVYECLSVCQCVCVRQHVRVRACVCVDFVSVNTFKCFYQPLNHVLIMLTETSQHLLQRDGRSVLTLSLPREVRGGALQ